VKDPANCDVIVVGAGSAALTAAIAARNEGARVIVLEKAPRESRSGNCRFTGGGFRIWHKGLAEVLEFVPDVPKEAAGSIIMGEYTTDVWYNKVMQLSEERADPKLTEIMVTESNQALRWLKDQGLVLEMEPERFAIREEGRLRWKAEDPALRAKGGGLGLANTLFSIAEKKGVEILYETTAQKLLRDSRGKISGVSVQSNEVFRDIKGKAVVLGCGGFESNREWRAKYLGPGWDLVRPRGTRYNTGDGLRMALEIGAQPAGHWSGCHATAIDYQHSIVPEGQDIAGVEDKRDDYYLGVLVNANGIRFLDEGKDFRSFVYAKYGASLLSQPKGMAWQIFDSKTTHLLQGDYRTGSCVTANSMKDLAEKLRIPTLTGTIEDFNGAVQPQIPLNYTVRDGRGTVGITPPKSNWAQKIDTPPFAAYPVGCGITFTFGGIKINPRAQVLGWNDKPIPGLYATGEMVGGIFYSTYTGGSGLILGVVFGRIAGANAAT